MEEQPGVSGDGASSFFHFRLTMGLSASHASNYATRMADKIDVRLYEKLYRRFLLQVQREATEVMAYPPGLRIVLPLAICYSICYNTRSWR